MKLDDRLSRMEGARPHVGEALLAIRQRLHSRLPQHLWDRYEELVALSEEDPYRSPLNAVAGRIGDAIAPGIADWSESVGALELPDEPWHSLAWRRVTIPRPPHVPANAAGYLLRDLERLDGVERDGHLLAACVLIAAEAAS